MARGTAGGARRHLIAAAFGNGAHSDKGGSIDGKPPPGPTKGISTSGSPPTLLARPQLPTKPQPPIRPSTAGAQGKGDASSLVPVCRDGASGAHEFLIRF